MPKHCQSWVLSPSDGVRGGGACADASLEVCLVILRIYNGTENTETCVIGAVVDATVDVTVGVTHDSKREKNNEISLTSR